jgi:ABC-2 type transport system permease protein
VVVDLWTKNLSDSTLNDAVQTAVGEAEHSQAMREAGLTPAVIAAIDQATPQVRTYSPKAAGGRVSLRDQLPALVGFGLGFLLWMVVLTSTTLLLNSVIEEKSNRVLEVLMSSASIPEILGGKILGVAGLAATVLVVWGIMGSIALNRFAPGMTGDILQAVLSRGLIVYFALYFIGGYLMYASIFAAIGAFCETVREAQTLVGPLMMLLIVPIMFMSMTITRPDAPMLDVLSWIPPFTPFLMAARVASGPPLWEVLGTLVVMFATAAVVVWISARAFRAGALSTAKLDRKRLFATLLKASRA